MNSFAKTVSKLDAVLDNLIAGKIDATTASAAASIVRAQAAQTNNEINMARHGKMLNQVQAEWQARLASKTED